MSEFKILKPSEIGRGILIENEGYISPSDERNIPFINEVQKLAEGKRIIVEPLTVFAVLQKYGVLNKNGRFYPEKVLKREAQKYEEIIKQRQALGECVPAGTEIFTNSGWKNIEDITVGEDIFTLNVESGELEVKPVLHTPKHHYNDDLIRISNSTSLDMVVTKNHKIVLWDRKDRPYTVTAEELYERIQRNDSVINHSYIKHSGTWKGKDPKVIRIPNTDIEIDSKLWASFLGIFLAEGHCGGSKGGKKTNLVCVTQTKEESKGRIKDLFDKLPFEYTLSGGRQFCIRHKDLHNFLFELGNSFEKHIPKYVKEWNSELLEILLEWMLLGDGSNKKDYKGEIQKQLYTISPRLADDTFELFLKISNGATYTERAHDLLDRYFTDIITIDKEYEDENGELVLVKEQVKTKRLIKKENSHRLNVISERRTKGIYLDSRFLKTEKIPFNDNVYCVTVENGTWLMRCNGKISWTHNSNHPESTVIDNDRISHEIKKIWWEGKTLVGEIEIIMSPGFVNMGIISCEGDRIANYLRRGIQIGVSSRGIGSLEESRDGYNIVQEDFELICWDIVTRPSTPGSYIFTRAEEARPFMESENKKNIFIDKLNKFLLD